MSDKSLYERIKNSRAEEVVTRFLRKRGVQLTVAPAFLAIVLDAPDWLSAVLALLPAAAAQRWAWALETMCDRYLEDDA